MVNFRASSCGKKPPEWFIKFYSWEKGRLGERAPLKIGSSKPDAILPKISSTLRHLGSNLGHQCTGSSPFFARGLHEDEATVPHRACDDQHDLRHRRWPTVLPASYAQIKGALSDAQCLRLKSRRGSGTFQTNLAKFDKKLADWLIWTSTTQRSAQHFKLVKR